MRRAFALAQGEPWSIAVGPGFCEPYAQDTRGAYPVSAGGLWL